MVDWINLLINMLGLLQWNLTTICIATVDTLNSGWVIILLGKSDTVSPHRWILLRLGLQLLLLSLLRWMHMTSNKLSIESSCQIVAVLQWLNVIWGVLVVLWILVACWMMDVNIGVVIIYYNNSTTIGYVIHVLWTIMLLLLRCLITLLLCM